VHLLNVQAGDITDGSEAVDLNQQPAEVIVLSAADTELAALAQAKNTLGSSVPELRLANLMQLDHNMSVDVYIDKTISKSKLVIIRLLGGHSYWPYGIEQIASICADNNIQLAVLPGDDQPDPELDRFSSLDADKRHSLWQYLVHGGPANAQGFLKFTGHLLHGNESPADAAMLLKAGLYWPDILLPTIEQVQQNWRDNAPVVALTFYRALIQGGSLAPIDALIKALETQGLNALPIFISSLKDEVSAATIDHLFEQCSPDVVLNATGFAVSKPGNKWQTTPLDATGAPVLQVVLSSSNQEQWQSSQRGLGLRDLAMNVVLPELDGRILSRAISFKSQSEFDAQTQAGIVTYKTLGDRCEFVAQLAKGWSDLHRTNVAEKRIAIVLANYPNRDGRLGNGVGLDTPAGVIEVVRAMKDSGYSITDMPNSGDELIEYLQRGPTNAATDAREIRETLALQDYKAFFSTLPDGVQQQVSDKWGRPEDDPFIIDGDRFALAIARFGNLAIGIQPARGYNIDPKQTYHDPDLVPPHGYLAFYAWLRNHFKALAIIHFGKHGNLEWLPGKAVGLSQSCYPEATLGPTPHIYPFIVNDPGEGTQAKRRASAVIIDHLTPPMTRAETYGPLKDLEALVDEYYEAAFLDPRRVTYLRQEILDLTRATGLDIDCGIIETDKNDTALQKLDNYLCELKEMQIRDGLHIFGVSPQGTQQTDLLVALTRVARGAGGNGDQSLIRALSSDFGFDDFDPLDCTLGDPWQGDRPEVLSAQDKTSPWRTIGDTVERLELLAVNLVSGAADCLNHWSHTQSVLEEIETRIKPDLMDSGPREITSVLQSLDGCFIPPGPSGAPTRGRVDVLPTGKNFYSVDSRAIPTQAAWYLGEKSAALLVERHRQDHGEWPRYFGLSAWGTSNMRTGGDDIAQALALIGAKPKWDTASGRVIGFEITPYAKLDRPRVDVTLRISGFFRDAFPAQIDLFDSAIRAIGALDEEENMNPIAARMALETAELVASGVDKKTAKSRAGFRIFGSKPGAYGAGLQALIDEKGWNSADDLARAYLVWGGYAYGSGAEGTPETEFFAKRLARVDAVIHNQDNREHDLLDSDDYYQFEGGMSAAVEHLKGARPAIYHNDHSRPERPVIRALDEEIGRVVRARVVNPKWINGVRRHGYKGAFEIAATVDYLFAFAATTGAVRDHHFDAVYDAFIRDDEVRDFIEDANPHALKDIADKLVEAVDRKLWSPKSNSAKFKLEEVLAR
jgi:cobaltochelatase CobN